MTAKNEYQRDVLIIISTRFWWDDCIVASTQYETTCGNKFPRMLELRPICNREEHETVSWTARKHSRQSTYVLYMWLVAAWLRYTHTDTQSHIPSKVEPWIYVDITARQLTGERSEVKIKRMRCWDTVRAYVKSIILMAVAWKRTTKAFGRHRLRSIVEVLACVCRSASWLNALRLSVSLSFGPPPPPFARSVYVNTISQLNAENQYVLFKLSACINFD